MKTTRSTALNRDPKGNRHLAVMLGMLALVLMWAGPLPAQIDYSTYPYCSGPTTMSGRITYYSLTTLVNCSITTDHFDTSRYAAINEYDYQSSAGCGSCIRIWRQKRPIP